MEETKTLKHQYIMYNKDQLVSDNMSISIPHSSPYFFNPPLSDQVITTSIFLQNN